VARPGPGGPHVGRSSGIPGEGGRAVRLRSDGRGTETVEGAQPFLAPQIRDGWLAFQLSLGGAWKGSVDRRTGQIVDGRCHGRPRPALDSGAPQPSSPADIAQHLKGKAKPDLQTLESIARRLPAARRPAARRRPERSRARSGRSGRGPGRSGSSISTSSREGRPIDGARVFFRIRQGNLIQLGSENLPSPGSGGPHRDAHAVPRP